MEYTDLEELGEKASTISILEGENIFEWLLEKYPINSEEYIDNDSIILNSLCLALVNFANKLKCNKKTFIDFIYSHLRENLLSEKE